MGTTTDALEPKDAEGSVPVRPGRLFRNGASGVSFRERFVHDEADLQFLDCGEYNLPPGSRSAQYAIPGRETLLFMWKGSVSVELLGRTFDLEPYDTLYIPLEAPFQLRNTGVAEGRVIQCSAPADAVHPACHTRFAECSRREDRIRHLKGKEVYLMFDVGEEADKLVAGYTFFQPHARSWPPHNHTDQEEAYIFIKGRGAMEVYDDPENMTFVQSVEEGDLVTIPFLNYHPVFSQDEPLIFIWCIAGERYWVGDKNKEFMKGEGPAITT